MTFLASFLALSSKSDSTPIVFDLNEGQQIFRRGQAINQTERDARIVIGKWFNGEQTVVVEEAVFITSGLLSRWLGYQNAAGTSNDDIQNSWSKSHAQFSSKPIALIRLARLCTVDPIDQDLDNSGIPEALDDVSIQIHQQGKPWTTMTVQTVQDIQQRRPDEVLKETWDQVLAKFTAWPAKPTVNELIPAIRWGKNRRVSLVAETPIFPGGSKCEMKIVEKDRTRIIPFRYPKS